MPWQLNGTFQRVSPPYTGSTVWEQNRQGGYKVVASRHDTHDQDMADGISQSLNTNGYNAMLANMNMGGFKITNLLDGTSAADSINFGQLDAVQTQVDDNAAAIAAINTSDPASIITAVNWDFTDLTHVRAVGDFVVSLNRFDNFKAGNIIRHNGVDLTWASVTEVDTQIANRWYLFNNNPGTFDINFTYPTGADPDLGENYFTEGMIIIENGALTASLPTIQAGGVDVNPNDIIGSPTSNANTTYTLSYSIQRTLGDVYRVAYIWSAP